MKMSNLDERDERLIEERESYEKHYFENIVDEIIESDALDMLIAERLNYIDQNFDFEPTPAYDMLEEFYYHPLDSVFEQIRSDVIDYIDYPEGPDENIDGIKYDDFYNHMDEDYYDLDIDLQLEREIQLHEIEVSEEPDYLEMYNNFVEEVFIEYHDNEDKYLENLIKQHIEEEKEFLDNIVVDVIVDDSYFEKAIDELIFDEIEIDYEPDLFDYDDDGYWYDPQLEPQDESIIEPFENLDGIDYPEGEPKFEYPIIEDYEEEIERDFEAFQRQKLKKSHEKGVNNNHVQNNELIENKDKIQSIFKDFIEKDDSLDKIIKQKLKEKKFNK